MFFRLSQGQFACLRSVMSRETSITPSMPPEGQMKGVRVTSISKGLPSPVSTMHSMLWLAPLSITC